MSTFRFDEDNVGHQLARQRRAYLWQGAKHVVCAFLFWGGCLVLGWFVYRSFLA